jgi:hypothetical protein
MQLIQVHAPSPPPRWLLAGGALALALGAGPASAAVTGVSLASAAAAVRAAEAQPVLVSPGTPSDTSPGDTGLLPRGGHAAVLAPGAMTPGAPGSMSAKDRDRPAPLITAQHVRAVGTGDQATGFHAPEPPVLSIDEAAAGGTEGMSAKDRERPPALMTTEHMRPVGTGDQATGDHTPAPPPALAIGETTPGGAEGMSAKQRELRAPSMAPQHVRALGTGDQPAGAHAPHPSSFQGWTLAAFPGAQGPLLVFSEANRLWLATPASFPSPSAALDLPGTILDLGVVAAGEGLLLVLADLGSEGVAVVDVADPAQPLLIALVR